MFSDYTVQQIFRLKKLKNEQECFWVICGHWVRIWTFFLRRRQDFPKKAFEFLVKIDAFYIFEHYCP